MHTVLSTAVYPMILVNMEETLASFVKERREALGLSQRALAELIGTSSAYMNQIEKGKTNWPQGNIANLARALGVSQQRLAIAAGLIEDETGEREKRPSLLAGNQQVQTLLTLLEYADIKTHQMHALIEVVRGFDAYNQRATPDRDTDEPSGA